MEARSSLKEISLKVLAWLVFGIYMVVLAQAILFKAGYIVTLDFELIQRKLAHSNFVPFKTIVEYLFEAENKRVATHNVAGNIVGFMPFGFLLPIVVKGVRDFKKIAYIAFITSLIFELTQLVFVVGSFDVDDMLLNTMGAVCGYALYRIFNKSIPITAKH